MSIVQRAKGKIRFAFKDPLKELIKNPNKESLIMMHFSYGEIRFKYSTGYYTCFNDWDHSKQRLKNKAHILNRGSVNDLLNTLETELYKELSSIEAKQEKIDRDILRRKLDEITNKQPPVEEEVEPNLFNYMDKYLSIRKGTLAKITVLSYMQTRKSLERYKSKINFNDITLAFYYGFIEFLVVENMSVNTIGKHIKNLKAVLRSATQEGLNNNLTYTHREFKVLREQTKTIYLDEKELKKMAEYDLSNYPKLDLARDIFLIGCYTGQRISDYNGLTKNHFYQKDGIQFFKIRQKKTKKEVLCPITVEIQAILNKPQHNGAPPKKMNEQEINKYIKEVGRKVGIDKIAKRSRTKGGLLVEESLPKYQLITTHTARRSFCTNKFDDGMPIYQIMHFSGHSTEKDFFNYIKFEPEQKAIKYAQSGYFNLK